MLQIQGTPEAPETVPAERLLEALSRGERINVRHATIEGNLQVGDYLDYPHPLILLNCVFRGHFSAPFSHFGRNVMLSGSRFEENLNLERVRIDGDFYLTGVQIQRGLGISAPWKSPTAADFERLAVGGVMEASYLTCESDLLLRDAAVGSALYLSGAEVRGDLNLENAALDELYCGFLGGRPTTVHGRTDLPQVRVARDIVLEGVVLKKGLNLLQAVVRGGLWCRPTTGGNRPTFGEDVYLKGAKIDGRVAIQAAMIRGHLFLENALLGSDLLCNPVEDQRTEVGGDFQGSQAAVRGRVDLSGCHVQGSLNLAGSQMDTLWLLARSAGGPLVGGPIHLHDSRVSRVLLDGRACAEGAGELRLAGAQVNTFRVENQVPARIDAENFRFQRLEVPNDDYSGWLRACSFYQSTYLQVENWLRNRGSTERANEVYVNMRRRHREGLGPRSFGYWEDLVLDRLTLYGLAPWRLLLLYFVPVLLLSVWLFSAPVSVQQEVQVPRREHTDLHELLPRAVHPRAGEWAWGDAFWVALRVNLPMFSFGARDDWKPSDAGSPLGITYQSCASTASLLSWLVAGFAAVYGLWANRGRLHAAASQ